MKDFDEVVFVISSQDGGGGPKATETIMDSLAEYNIKRDLYIFNQRGRKNLSLINFFSAFRYIKRLSNNQKLIVFNSGGLGIGFLLNLIILILNVLFKRKIKSVQIYHNRIFSVETNKLNNLIRLAISDLIILMSDAFICVSNGIRNEILRAGFFRKKKKSCGYTIYNPLRSLNSSLKESHSLYPFEGPVILAVGRLCKQKGFDTLIKAHANILNTVKAHLVIVGEGTEYSKLENLVRNYSDSDYVHFWGYDNNIANHYSSADVFVLSSIHEGFGLVLLEAMSCGLPVISTNCPYGPEEILNFGEYGDIVNVSDIVGLSKSIIDVLNLPSDILQIRIKNGIERASEFSISNIGEQYIRLIKEFSFEE